MPFYSGNLTLSNLFDAKVLYFTASPTQQHHSFSETKPASTVHAAGVLVRNQAQWVQKTNLNPYVKCTIQVNFLYPINWQLLLKHQWSIWEITRNFKWASAAGKMSAFIEKVARFGQIDYFSQNETVYANFRMKSCWKPQNLINCSKPC